jgi:hypothetical protein
MAVRVPRSVAMKRKLMLSGLLVLLLTTLVSAQDSASEPRDLTVLEKSWKKTFFVPRAGSNILRPNEDLIQQTRVEKRVIENREKDIHKESTTERSVPTPRMHPIGGPPVTLYVYKMKVKNTGRKTIRSIDWEYQFLHPETKEIMGSARAMSKVKVAPGKIKQLEGQTTRPLTKLISADQLGKKEGEQFEERVIIHRIYYTDGPAWRRQP